MRDDSQRARSARHDPPATVGDYLGWIDPEKYGGAVKWQALHFDGSRWWYVMGNVRLIAFPEWWMASPPDPTTGD